MRVSARVVMKLVSPFQRGTQCMWKCPGTPAPALRPRLAPTFSPSGEYPSLSARNFDDTVFKTNLEAGQAIARQLRLRNLGGIIIIDFIDMAREEHQAAVLAELKKQLARDRTRVTVSGFTQLGLVEMTRKRTRESLAHLLCEPCPICQGRGEVKTARSVCHDILREILREARQFNPKEFRVLASAAVVEMLLDEESQHLAGLSDFIGKPISLRAEPFPSPEQYDIVLL